LDHKGGMTTDNSDEGQHISITLGLGIVGGNRGDGVSGTLPPLLNSTPKPTPHHRITRHPQRTRNSCAPEFHIFAHEFKTVRKKVFWLVLIKQEAQLSPRDRAMHCVSWNLANYHAAMQKLLVRQVLNKSMSWSWRFSWRQCVINMCTQPWRDRVASIVL